MTDDHNGEPGLMIDFEPPKYHCGTHGDHVHWVQFVYAGKPTVMYCLQCVMDFLDRQSIGKVVRP